ncbi:MAG: hypothetical protein IM445_09120, partial [Microcystis sp. M015S1]|nr:hypothetical protein [Microcystis sp. M015S1]MCA3161573.1 hypothetical protein [Burkholderiales bacterium]
DESGEDTLVFKGISASQVTLVGEQVGSRSDLIFYIDANNSVRVKNWVNHSGSRIEVVQFDGGVVWNSTTLGGKPVFVTLDNNNNVWNYWTASLAHTIYGKAGLDTIYGGGLADWIDGGVDDDRLFGEAGNDTLLGGAGADYFDGGAGDDTMNGGADNDSLYDVSGKNYFIGEGGNDTLTGTGIFEGGVGNDYITASTGADTYLFNIGDGQDTVFESGSGADTLIFGDGIQRQYIYLRQDGLDMVLQVGGSTDDQIIFKGWFDASSKRIESVHFADGSILNSSQLVPTVTVAKLGTNSDDSMEGTNGIDIMSGYAGNDTLWGYGSDDELNGGTGADVMYGGEGDDAYIVDNPLDQVIELQGQGTDTVNSSISWILGDNVENLNLGGTTNINGTGNEVNNRLVGSSGENTLSGLDGNDYLAGKAGNDTLIGGSGADTYAFGRGDGADLIVENDSTLLIYDQLQFGNFINIYQVWFVKNGVDLVVSIIGTTDKVTIKNWYNDTSMHVERFQTVDGKILSDAQIDTLVAAMAQFDPPALGVTTLPADYMQTLASVIDQAWLVRIQGTDSNDTLTGTGGNDFMDGGEGADTMTGGLGNDTYYVDNIGDVVTEEENQGNDTVFSSINGYTLTADAENLTLLGNLNLNGNGNNLVNVLTGNDGNNVLDGAANADTMIGGKGDDTYIVDNAGDVIVEQEGEGNDTVVSSSNYVLGTCLENLTLTGTAAINGTGNASNNILTGNGGNNTLVGGLGDDTYLFGRGSGIDTVVDAGGSQDKLQLGANISLDDLWLKWTTIGQDVDTLTIGLGSANVNETYAAVQDAVTLLSATSSAGKVESLSLSDGTVVDLQLLISAMASFAPQQAGSGVHLADATVKNHLIQNLVIPG